MCRRSNPVTALKGIETCRVAGNATMECRSNPVTALKGIETRGLDGGRVAAGVQTQ